MVHLAMLISIRERLHLVAFIVVLSVGIGFGLNQQPTYTDAFYYAVGARTLAEGGGFSQPFLWNYIGDPTNLVVPSHTYWMPMPSLLGAIGMRLSGMNYWGAQAVFVALLCLLGMMAGWLAYTLTASRRMLWLTVAVVISGGYYGRFWGMTSTFTPYALFGGACLLALGLGLQRTGWHWFVWAGVLAGLAHLTRADGILLLGCGVLVVVFGGTRRIFSIRQVALYGSLLFITYGLCTAPWWIFNQLRLGMAFPTGGTVGIWLQEYDDLFRYPMDVSLHEFLQSDWREILKVRWDALQHNLLTFLAVEAAIVLAPFTLIGAWQRRGEKLLLPFFLYALLLHLVMTFIFALPGMRGSLLHSSSALWMFWVVLGWEGLDHAIAWVAQRRRTWRKRQAQQVFSVGIACLMGGMSILIAFRQEPMDETAQWMAYLQTNFPADAVLMVNDPSHLYYYTRLSGVVLPNEQPHVIQEIAQRYGVAYLVLELVVDGVSFAAPTDLMNIPTDPPSFLTPIPVPFDTVRMYRIETP